LLKTVKNEHVLAVSALLLELQGFFVQSLQATTANIRRNREL